MGKAKIDKAKLNKILRVKLMSQKELAEKADITPYFLSRLCSNSSKFKASTDTCKGILKALGKEYRFEDVFFWVD